MPADLPQFTADLPQEPFQDVEPAPTPAHDLQDRIQRLEDAVALLSHQVRWEDEHRPEVPVFSDAMEKPAESPVPRAMPIPPPTAIIAELALPPLAEPPVQRTTAFQNVLRPIQTAFPLATSMVNKVLPASSLWRDVWWDLRIFFRMMRDPYYPMTTSFKVVPLFAVFYVTIWPLLSAWSGVIGTVMNYMVNAVVIYIAFKVIQRELRRYYEFAERYRR